MGDFVRLHVHDCYSINDGLCKVNDLVKRAKELGMKSLAITNHGNMYSAVYFYKACKKEGIKPIIGCEVYVQPNNKKKLVRDNRHLVLLAKNETGYKNLVKILSDANMEGFYYNPRTDLEFLKTHSEGLVALSACVGGDIAREYFQHIEENLNPFYEPTEEELQRLYEEAYIKTLKKVKKYIEIFGKENYFLEIQNNGLEDQYEWNEVIYRLAKSTGLRIVCTNDVHYVYKKDASVHDAVMAIQAGKTIFDKNRKSYGSDEFYLKSYDELNNGKVPQESLDITNEIANMCNFDFEFGNYHIPVYDCPEGFNNTEEFLDHLVEEGMIRRYGYERAMSKELQDRKTFELQVIRQMGFNDYFLLTWDFINFCKTNNIAVGPGRGSAAGSIVSYAIGITDVDPIRFDLLFFRFLNPDRVGMPDIDVDFSTKNRYKVINYVKEKYGRERVCSIITYQMKKAKSSVRNAGRVLDMPMRLVDKVAKLIPMDGDLKEIIEQSLELSSLYQTDNNVKQILDLAIGIQGTPSATSQHAAGIIIAPSRVDDYVPLMRSKDGEPVAAFDMSTLEELGMLKCDFLALKNLDIIDDCVELVEKNRGIKISRQDLLNFVDDPNTYKLVAEGKTLGLFQVESEGMSSYAKQMKIANIDELSALLALYRPRANGLYSSVYR